MVNFFTMVDLPPYFELKKVNFKAFDVRLNFTPFLPQFRKLVRTFPRLSRGWRNSRRATNPFQKFGRRGKLARQSCRRLAATKFKKNNEKIPRNRHPTINSDLKMSLVLIFLNFTDETNFLYYFVSITKVNSNRDNQDLLKVRNINFFNGNKRLHVAYLTY